MPPLRREGDRLLLEGKLGIETVPAVLREVRAACQDGVRVVDLTGVSEVDSAALALVVELLRETRAAGREVAFANLPPAMEKLAQLYAVSDLIVRG